MEFSINLPTDSESFLSHECTECKNIFKIEVKERDKISEIHCPYCNHKDEPKNFLTQGQLDFVKAMGANKLVSDVLFKNLRSTKNLKVTRSSSNPIPPEERNEGFLTIITSCCNLKVKIEENKKQDSYFCVECGNSFQS